MNYLQNIVLQNFSDKEIHRTIFLESVIRKMDIGIHDYEIGNPQRIEFNIYVVVKNDNKIFGDNIEEVMDYEYLIEIINSKIERRFSLLETLANEILEDVLSPEKVMGATVTISKLDIIDSGKIGCSISRLK
ncbi:MAG: dihydroneopterin aldolase [Candidatus Poseidoniales archaeon]|nr:MAG: dihydroneopterin aldolase [Candidatus Poseidoniales archaeon]